MPKDDKEKGVVKYNYFHWGPFLMHANVPKEECQIFLDEGKRCRKNKKLDFRHKLAGHLKEEYALDNPVKLAPVLKCKVTDIYPTAKRKFYFEL